MSDANIPPGQGGGYGDSYGGPPGGSAYAGPPPPGPGGYGRGSDDAKGFFGALFDFSFTSFVTPKIVKFVYVLVTVVIGLALVGYIIFGFATSPTLGLVVLLLGWIPALLYLAFARMTLEFYYSVVRMSQDINRRLPGA